MKVASAIWKNQNVNGTTLLDYMEAVTKKAAMDGHALVVFPALIGETDQDFLPAVRQLSSRYQDITICPGSYWEHAGGETYHVSCLLRKGKLLMKQRQLYLAKWERDLGLSRGEKISFTDFNGLKTAIILSTDVFYSQVSRYAALNHADLIVSPVAIKGSGNLPTQLSGIWQQVQQNLFFAVESGYKGNFKEKQFHSESIIHGPLEMSLGEGGFLARESGDDLFISTTLDLEKQREAKKHFNPLKQLNRSAYHQLFL